MEACSSYGPGPDLPEAHAGQVPARIPLDATVRIEGTDRPGLERLLRYCAGPAFALDRLREINAEHPAYESIKPAPGGSASRMLSRTKDY